jgi:coproporphyrinogen III oxidase-like Fe-S oxidoreductase
LPDSFPWGWVRQAWYVFFDLIFSVLGQSLLDWEDTLTQALALQPDHISAYNLTYEEDTAFFEKFQTGDYVDDPDLNAKMFSLADEMLVGHGFELTSTHLRLIGEGPLLVDAIATELA